MAEQDLKGKTLLMVAGSSVQVPAIQSAQARGARVITCDMNEKSPAQHITDVFELVSTTDLPGLVNLARKYNIDGVMTYASDPSAIGVAHVARELGLPGNDLDGVITLSRKNRFRDYQKSRGYFFPQAVSYVDPAEAVEAISRIGHKLVLKPTDSSGSKGLSVFHPRDISREQLVSKVDEAFSYSFEKRIVVEEYVARKGFQIAGDGFVANGKLAFHCFANEHFANTVNPYLHKGESFPAVHEPNDLQRVADVLGAILSDLGMTAGGFNFDAALTETGEVFVIEIGARNGGNLIPEVTRLATGVDMLSMSIDAAFGLPLDELVQVPVEGYWSSYILHTPRSGTFREIEVSPAIKNNLIEMRVYARPGMPVYPYIGSNRGVGACILRYDSRDEMLDKMERMEELLAVRLAD